VRLQETSPRPSYATLATTYFQPHAMQPLLPHAFSPSHTTFHIHSFVDIKKDRLYTSPPYVIKPTSFIMLNYQPECHSYYYHNENPLYVSNLYMVGITQLYGYVYLWWMYHCYPFELVVYHLVSLPL